VPEIRVIAIGVFYTISVRIAFADNYPGLPHHGYEDMENNSDDDYSGAQHDQISTAGEVPGNNSGAFSTARYGATILLNVKLDVIKRRRQGESTSVKNLLLPLFLAGNHPKIR